MVTINTRKTKRMKFGVSVSGIQPRDLKGSVRMEIGGIEYGFPTVVEDDKLAVEIPPLDEVIANLKEGQTVKARLDVLAGDKVLTPWADSFKIEKPITVEAKIDEMDDVEDVVTPTVKIELTEEVDEEPEKPVKEMCGADHKEKKKKKSNSKLAKMLSTK